ncbi:MAG: beta-lactamase family protein [Treponema sp.]|nr:beta-lactamase family protein [Treponema sp.]
MSISHIDTLLKGFVQRGQLPLVSATVWQGDRQIYRFQQGEYQPQKPVGDDTLFRVFSMTKVLPQQLCSSCTSADKSCWMIGIRISSLIS